MIQPIRNCKCKALSEKAVRAIIHKAFDIEALSSNDKFALYFPNTYRDLLIAEDEATEEILKLVVTKDTESSTKHESTLLMTLIISLIFVFFGGAALQKLESNYQQHIASILHEEEGRFLMIKRSAEDIETLKITVNILTNKIGKIYEYEN